MCPSLAGLAWFSGDLYAEFRALATQLAVGLTRTMYPGFGGEIGMVSPDFLQDLRFCAILLKLRYGVSPSRRETWMVLLASPNTSVHNLG